MISAPVDPLATWGCPDLRGCWSR